MTPQEIIDNNKLLAEFLGSEIEETLKGEKVYCLLLPDENDLTGFKKEFFAPDELKFHKDWNWLMLVVDKVESITVDEYADNSFNVTIGATNYCVIQDSNGELYESIEDYGESKLMTTYKTCVQFVKWFNQNKGGK